MYTVRQKCQDLKLEASNFGFLRVLWVTIRLTNICEVTGVSLAIFRAVIWL